MCAVDPSTVVTSGAGDVSIIEGEGLDISCTSTGFPVPSIVWTLDDQPVPYDQTDILTDYNINEGFNIEVTPGTMSSTLHIVNAQYPANDGVYKCTGSYNHAGTPVRDSAVVTMEVLGMYLVCMVTLCL